MLRKLISNRHPPSNTGRSTRTETVRWRFFCFPEFGVVRNSDDWAYLLVLNHVTTVVIIESYQSCSLNRVGACGCCSPYSIVQDLNVLTSAMRLSISKKY